MLPSLLQFARWPRSTGLRPGECRAAAPRGWRVDLPEFPAHAVAPSTSFHVRSDRDCFREECLGSFPAAQFVVPDREWFRLRCTPTAPLAGHLAWLEPHRL